ncbi:uncharacterized protein LOC132296299 [Cornus florida]|uniref:uncharacterized protein LOC132296299 n=1 Tax=Cornus florida TaxID=4283 RepID=UPI0028A1D1C2|nr:uncharacterized protein LOC132296299 [Cornus florida]
MAMFMKVLAIFVIAGTIVLDNSNSMVLGQCHGDMQGLVEQCSRFVQKPGPTVDPSKACCEVVQTLDFPCVCKNITQDVENIISMEKAVYVVGFCGKPLPHGSKCGSYTVP